VDVFRQDGSIALLGNGWHACEQFGETPFRWVGDDARLNVAQITHAPYTLSFEVEPGPAVGNKPFDLVVLEDAKQISSLRVSGRETMTIDLAAGIPRVRMLTLRARNAFPPQIPPGDPRILKYRVMNFTLSIKDDDVVSAAEGMAVGKGWYPLERFNGERFRWAGPEAIIQIDASAALEAVKLDIEPGPGVDFGPLKINVFAGNDAKGHIVIKNRERITIPWSRLPNSPELRLLVNGGGKMVSTDARAMNFRAFARER
jgi:hypothetical protein